MASRSLGTLVIDLVAKIGGFEQGMDKAARTADKRMTEIEASCRPHIARVEEDPRSQARRAQRLK